MPCILVENKADLLGENEIDNTQELEEFAEENGFDGSFRTSAKTGFNINEIIEFLIDKIIKRLKYMKIKEKEINLNPKSKIDIKYDNKSSQENKESKKAKKCSNKEHEDINATFYCNKCQIYLCDKCVDYHQKKFNEHQISSLDKISKEN